VSAGAGGTAARCARRHVGDRFPIFLCVVCHTDGAKLVPRQWPRAPCGPRRWRSDLSFSSPSTSDLASPRSGTGPAIPAVNVLLHLSIAAGVAPAARCAAVVRVLRMHPSAAVRTFSEDGVRRSTYVGDVGGGVDLRHCGTLRASQWLEEGRLLRSCAPIGVACGRTRITREPACSCGRHETKCDPTTATLGELASGSCVALVSSACLASAMAAGQRGRPPSDGSACKALYCRVIATSPWRVDNCRARAVPPFRNLPSGNDA
jgi:hypothetical protein